MSWIKDRTTALHVRLSSVATFHPSPFDDEPAPPAHPPTSFRPTNRRARAATTAPATTTSTFWHKATSAVEPPQRESPPSDGRTPVKLGPVGDNYAGSPEMNGEQSPLSAEDAGGRAPSSERGEVHSSQLLQPLPADLLHLIRTQHGELQRPAHLSIRLRNPQTQRRLSWERTGARPSRSPRKSRTVELQIRHRSEIPLQNRPRTRGPKRTPSQNLPSHRPHRDAIPPALRPRIPHQHHEVKQSLIILITRSPNQPPPPNTQYAGRSRVSSIATSPTTSSPSSRIPSRRYSKERKYR